MVQMSSLHCEFNESRRKGGGISNHNRPSRQQYVLRLNNQFLIRLGLLECLLSCSIEHLIGKALILLNSSESIDKDKNRDQLGFKLP